MRLVGPSWCYTEVSSPRGVVTAHTAVVSSPRYGPSSSFYPGNNEAMCLPGSSWRVLNVLNVPPGLLLAGPERWCYTPPVPCPACTVGYIYPPGYPVGAPSGTVPPDVAAGGACVHRWVCHFCTFGGPPEGHSVLIPGSEKKRRRDLLGHREEPEGV